MWRSGAVVAMLVEEVAGLGRRGPGDDGDGRGPGARAELERARRRGRLVVALDWTAILVLVILRSAAAPVLVLGPSEETVFALAILAVATHAGFRMGQLEKFAAVGRAVDEIESRADRG